MLEPKKTVRGQESTIDKENRKEDSRKIDHQLDEIQEQLAILRQEVSENRQQHSGAGFRSFWSCPVYRAGQYQRISPFDQIGLFIIQPVSLAD